jgi:Clp amino terminal domain, pathogenicity island component
MGPPRSEVDVQRRRRARSTPRGKLGAVFERFTDRVRRVLLLAQEEARLFDHRFIGTEHLLLGLLHEADGLAAKSLTSLGVSLDAARRAVDERTHPLPSGAPGSPPFTPEAKQLLELSLREALQLGHKGIDTEHLLLGLARQGESGAVQVLASLGVDLDQVRRTLLSFMSEPGYVPSDEGAIVGDAPRAHRSNLRGARLEPSARRTAFVSQTPPDDLDSDSGADDGPPAMRTPPREVPATMASELASRYDRLPVQRIRRHADLWALRRVEEEHVDRLARQHELDDVTRDATMSWWLEEVQRRCGGTSARLQREERRRLQRIHRHPRFRSNAVFQLYWNTVGPGGRTWFGNRYATIRRYTFRIRWRP